jgi:hypothetical protein
LYPRTFAVLRWFLVVLLAIALIGWLNPLLRRLGLGRLPGDVRFTRNGREYTFPFTSTLLLSALLTWLAYALR